MAFVRRCDKLCAFPEHAQFSRPSVKMVQHCATEEELQQVIANAPGLLVVDFYAQWCGPCKAIAPKLDDLAANYAAEGLTVVKVDIEAVPAAPAKYNVSMMPTFVFFQGGSETARVIGANFNKLRRTVLDQISEE